MSPSPGVDSGDPGPTEVIDRFAPELIPVDVLLVVDDSASMSDEQSQLFPGLVPLVHALAQAGGDFRLGVATTDLETPEGLVEVDGARWLDDSTADPAAWFEAALPTELLGSTTEQGSGAVFLTLEQSDTDFHRPDAALHALVVTDEPDYTRDGIVSATDFTTWFEALDPDGERRTFSALGAPSGEGARYERTATALGGAFGRLTDDWALVVDAVADRARRYERRLPLSAEPVPATVVVTRERGGVAETLVAGVDYTVVDRAVELVEEPSADDTFEVTYDAVGT